jgi:hypothetical protein
VPGAERIQPARRVVWAYAKTMPTVPHEYALKRDQHADTFNRAVAFIRNHGWRAHWGRAWHTYWGGR